MTSRTGTVVPVIVSVVLCFGGGCLPGLDGSNFDVVVLYTTQNVFTGNTASIEDEHKRAAADGVSGGEDAIADLEDAFEVLIEESALPAISTDGALIAVQQTGAATIDVVSLDDGSVKSTITPPTNAAALAIEEGGRRVAVMAAGSSLQLVDTVTGDVTDAGTVVGIGPARFARDALYWLEDGGVLQRVEEDGTRTTITTTPGEVKKIFSEPLGAALWGTGIATDGFTTFNFRVDAGATEATDLGLAEGSVIQSVGRDGRLIVVGGGAFQFTGPNGADPVDVPDTQGSGPTDTVYVLSPDGSGVVQYISGGALQFYRKNNIAEQFVVNTAAELALVVARQ